MKKAILIIFGYLFFHLNTIGQAFNFEASLLVQQMSGDKSYFESDEFIPIEVTNFMSYGFQAGMNLGHFNLGIDFLFGNSEIISQNNFEVAVSCFDADLEYFFLKKSLTPLITAGIGSVNYTDSFTSVETLNENDFSYNVGAGLKWLIKDRFFIKPLYRFTFSKIQGTTDGLIFHGLHIGVGYIFNLQKS